jgi:hypothetical protein
MTLEEVKAELIQYKAMKNLAESLCHQTVVGEFDEKIMLLERQLKVAEVNDD